MTFSKFYRSSWVVLTVLATVWGFFLGNGGMGTMPLTMIISGVVVIGLVFTLFVAGRGITVPTRQEKKDRKSELKAEKKAEKKAQEMENLINGV